MKKDLKYESVFTFVKPWGAYINIFAYGYCIFILCAVGVRVKYTDSTNRHKQAQTDSNKGNSMHKQATNPPQTIF